MNKNINNKNQNKLNIFQQNIQSFSKNKSELIYELNKNEFDVAILCETFTKLNNIYNLTGFNVFFKSRPDGHGGVGIVVSKKISC